jgi:hypothetical protein
VVDEVLTPELKRYLRTPINERDKSTLNSLVEHPTHTIPRPTPSRGYTVIKCTIHNETAKAFNFKVLLNSSKYTVRFPFTPSLYIWMPKSMVHKLDGGYYEAATFMVMENLNKALVSLKKKLISDYGFTSAEIIQIDRVHLS